MKKHGEEEGTAIPVKDDAALLLRAAETENALQLLTKAAEDYARDHAAKTDFLKDGFDVSYSGFMQMKEKSGEAEEIIARAKALSEEKAALAAEGYSLAREEKALLPYADIDLPFADAESTKRTGFFLGVIPAAKEEDFQAAIAAAEYVGAAAEKLGKCETGGVYLIAYLKSEKNKADELLGASGFSRVSVRIRRKRICFGESPLRKHGLRKFPETSGAGKTRRNFSLFRKRYRF